MSAWFSFPDFFLSFAALLHEGIPFLLLGALGSALVDLFLPEAWLRALLRLGPRGGIAVGFLAGFLFPICECGALPIVLRLLRKGVPLPAAAAYLFGAPLVNPFTLLSTWLAFRTQEPWLMVILRTVLGGLVVLSLSLWLGRCDSREILNPAALNPDPLPGADAEGSSLSESPWKRRLRATVRGVADDFLAVAFFLVVGAAVAAFLNTSVNRGWLEPLAQNRVLGPVAAVILAQTLSLCSTTDAFIIAALPQFPMAAALAFLVAGPLFDFKLLWIYQALFTRSTVLRIWIRVTAGALLLSWLYSLL